MAGLWKASIPYGTPTAGYETYYMISASAGQAFILSRPHDPTGCSTVEALALTVDGPGVFDTVSQTYGTYGSGAGGLSCIDGISRAGYKGVIAVAPPVASYQHDGGLYGYTQVPGTSAGAHVYDLSGTWKTELGVVVTIDGARFTTTDPESGCVTSGALSTPVGAPAVSNVYYALATTSGCTGDNAWLNGLQVGGPVAVDDSTSPIVLVGAGLYGDYGLGGTATRQ